MGMEPKSQKSRKRRPPAVVEDGVSPTGSRTVPPGRLVSRPVKRPEQDVALETYEQPARRGGIDEPTRGDNVERPAAGERTARPERGRRLGWWTFAIPESLRGYVV